MVSGDQLMRHGRPAGSGADAHAKEHEDGELVALAERWKLAFRALVDFQQSVGHSGRPCHNWDAATLDMLDRLVEEEHEAREILDGFLVGSFREPPAAQPE